ncbi:unnamed protein product [Auanema sp. JU1783]|nr:unnamed protein product [Auanema sp. JU1783]
MIMANQRRRARRITGRSISHARIVPSSSTETAIEIDDEEQERKDALVEYFNQSAMNFRNGGLLTSDEDNDELPASWLFDSIGCIRKFEEKKLRCEIDQLIMSIENGDVMDEKLVSYSLDRLRDWLIRNEMEIENICVLRQDVEKILEEDQIDRMLIRSVASTIKQIKSIVR